MSRASPLTHNDLDFDDSRWHPLYRIAAISALISVVLFLFQIIGYSLHPSSLLGNLLQCYPPSLSGIVHCTGGLLAMRGTHSKFNRRTLLTSAGLATMGLALPTASLVTAQANLPTANGGTDPYPIPWLDKNGSHNQPAGPNLEPSHIYHFKGKIARCNTFNGMGTDNQGNRIPFGAPTTDYGVMQGEYWAARAPQQGTYTHI